MELDALPPDVLRDLVAQAVRRYLPRNLDDLREREAAARAYLVTLADEAQHREV